MPVRCRLSFTNFYANIYVSSAGSGEVTADQDANEADDVEERSANGTPPPSDNASVGNEEDDPMLDEEREAPATETPGADEIGSENSADEAEGDMEEEEGGEKGEESEMEEDDEEVDSE